MCVASTADNTFLQKDEATETAAVQPHHWFFHPHLGWVDILLSFIMYLLLPLHKLSALSPTKADSQKEVEKFRSATASMGSAGVAVSMGNWSKTLTQASQKKVAILQHNYRLSRRPDILKEWGILDDKQDAKLREMAPAVDDGDAGISVMAFFPDTLLESTATAKSESLPQSDLKCRLVSADALDWSGQLLPRVASMGGAVLVAMHGGGMCVGSPQEPNVTDTVATLAEYHPNKPCVVLLVSYRQFPDGPFPGAVQDCLTVLDDLLESKGLLSIMHGEGGKSHGMLHLIGASAGGNLAAVTAMELHRKYPSALASCTIQAPMLDPTANSLSYQENDRVLFVNAAWLKWSWCGYLQLPDTAAWSAWQQTHGRGVARLVSPAVDLPSDLTATRFLVVTNEGDPLREDGLHFVQALQQAQAPVRLLRHPGTHCFGTVMNRRNFREFVQILGETMFPVQTAMK